MTNSGKANELRKSGDIDSALPIYKELWESSGDKFAAAGLLFCYRKKRLFDKALPLAEEAYLKFRDFEWCKTEYIWTLIQGKLFTFPEDGSLLDFVAIVNQIIELKPEEVAYKIALFSLLKRAKKKGAWDLLNEWIVKITPEILTGYTDEETGWTDKVLWYYYRAIGLIYSHNENEAIKLIDESCGNFYHQKKYFDRLKAKALISQNNIKAALVVYKTLVTGKADWWLLHEYGNLLIKNDNIEEGFALLVKAAMAPPNKLELKVTLFSDMGSVLVQLKEPNQAVLHFKLAKAIREREGWAVGELDNKIINLVGDASDEIDLKNVLIDCQKMWRSYLSKDVQRPSRGGLMTGLTGTVTNLINDRPFCFIKTRDNQSYFCSTDDLPEGITANQRVKFDIKPSFDKKKKKETFRATNIRRLS